MHFCQEYYVGNWYWSKYRFPHDYLTCESPIAAMPPSNLGSDYADYRLDPGGSRTEKIHMNFNEKARNAFMICAISSVLQEAATYYKKHSCELDKANFEPTLNLYEHLTLQ